ncbi:MAG: phage tail protein I [Oscillospiraceae bacterium]
MSNSIYEADYLRTLPEVLKRDETMFALATVIGNKLREVSSETLNAIIYAKIDTLPVAMLDILAYDFKVDWWDGNYTVEEKRKLLKDSWNVHRHLGTKSAIETALSAIYPDTKVLEWFDYNGAAYCFKLLIDATYQNVSPARHQRVLDRVEYYKNLRSHLDGVEYTAQPLGSCITYSAIGACGQEIEFTVEVAVHGMG